MALTQYDKLSLRTLTRDDNSEPMMTIETCVRKSVNPSIRLLVSVDFYSVWLVFGRDTDSRLTRAFRFRQRKQNKKKLETQNPLF